MVPFDKKVAMLAVLFTPETELRHHRAVMMLARRGLSHTVEKPEVVSN